MTTGLLLVLACGDTAGAPPSPPLENLVEPTCTPGAVRSCYGGPASSEAVGQCRAGIEACLPDGSGWGLCVGEVRPAARESCGDALDDDCDGQTSCGETEWLRRWGTDVDEVVMAVDIDVAGNTYLAGYHRGPLDLGAGPLTYTEGRDLFFASLDREGSTRWSATLSGAGNHLARAVAVGDEDVVFAVSARGAVTLPDGSTSDGFGGDDVLLVSLGLDGEQRWWRRFDGDAADVPGALARGPDGAVVVGGWHVGSITIGGQSHTAVGPHDDIFVAALGPGGEVTSVRFFEGPDDQFIRGVAVEGARVYVSGYLQGQLTVGDETLVADGPERDAFMIALEAGEVRWARRWGGPAEDRAFGCAALDDGVVVTGRTEGPLDLGGGLVTGVGGGAWVAQFSASGEHRWSRSVVEAPDAGAYDVAVDGRGDVVVTGYYEGPAFDGATALEEAGIDQPALLVAKLTPSGASRWSRGLRVSREQTAGGTFRAWRQVAGRGDGTVVVGGYVRGAWIDAGTPGERADAFILSLAP